MDYGGLNTFLVTYHPRDKDITREFPTEEEANNFIKNMKSLGFKVVGQPDPQTKNSNKIEWR